MNHKLIVFDIDGTIMTHVSSWQYIHERLNLWDDLARKYQEQFLAGRISYRKFCELDAAHWKGLDVAELREIFEEIPYTENAPECIRDLKKLGYKMAALSTGLQFLADRIKKDLGIRHIICNRLTVRNGKLSGGVKINLTHGAKGTALKKIVKKYSLKPSEAIGVGDSGGDIPLARAAGYFIAFNSSSKELSQIADYDCQTTDFRELYENILSLNQ